MQLKVEDRHLPLIAIAASILISIWSIFTDSIINNDGILYLEMADLILAGQSEAAAEMHRWVFFSYLIAGVVKITGLSTLTAGYAINTLFGAIIVYCFLGAVRELGADRKVMLWAIVVILLFPTLNKYRSFVSRDFGFLAGYMAALWMYVRYINTPRLPLLLAAAAFMLVSGLFRVEALVFVIGLPLIAFYFKLPSKRARTTFVLLLPVAAGLASVLLAWWLTAEAHFKDAHGFMEIIKLSYTSFWGSVGNNMDARLDTIAKDLLNTQSDKFAIPVLVLTMFAILAGEITRAISLPFVLALIYGLKQGVRFPREAFHPYWNGTLLVHLVMLTAVVVYYLFLTGRFPIAMAMTVLLFIPFAMSRLTRQWQSYRAAGKARYGYPILIALLISHGLDGLWRLSNKYYIRDAGQWVQAHFDRDAKLWTNEQLMTFYSGRTMRERNYNVSREQIEKLLKSNEWKNYDVLAVSIKKRHRKWFSPMLYKTKLQPVKRFKNGSGDRMVIYRTRDLQDKQTN